LGKAVVVAGDRSRADVDALADGGIADVGQVIHFRTASDPRLLHFDKITDVRALGDHGAGSQPREGSDARAVLHLSGLDDRVRPDLAAARDFGIAANQAPGPDSRIRFDRHAGLN